MNVVKSISLSDCYEQETNFLIGSGASLGLFPTLSTNMKTPDGNGWESVETLGKYFEDSGLIQLKSLLFMHYYENCIKPTMELDVGNLSFLESILGDSTKEMNVLRNYQALLNTVGVSLTKKRKCKKVNIFTTNYDSCFVEAYEELLKSEPHLNLKINDGSKGFRRKFVEAKNYDSYEMTHSIFSRSNAKEIPQINLVHLHGSSFWRLEDHKIMVDYSLMEKPYFSDNFFKPVQELISNLDGILKSEASVRESFNDLELGEEFAVIEAKFWEKYNKLPIVNPTKWKFHETVFDEHYYQMLRLMSYELEKENSTLITFGFSFADEHILNLIKRSLGNKSLTMYVCCFNESEKEKMKLMFTGYNNVNLVQSDANLDFSEFNESVFTLKGLV